MLQALELLNGGIAYGMVQAGAANYASMDDKQAVEEIYLSALCRFPTVQERRTAQRFLSRGAVRGVAVADLLWTMVNTREFLFQH